MVNPALVTAEPQLVGFAAFDAGRRWLVAAGGDEDENDDDTGGGDPDEADPSPPVPEPTPQPEPAQPAKPIGRSAGTHGEQ